MYIGYIGKQVKLHGSVTYHSPFFMEGGYYHYAKTGHFYFVTTGHFYSVTTVDGVRLRSNLAGAAGTHFARQHL